MTRHHLAQVLILPLLAAALCGCDSDPDKIPAGAGGEPGAAGASNEPSSIVGVCADGENPKSPRREVKVESVLAQFVDEQGAATPVGRVQVCGIDVCRDVTDKVSKTGKLSAGLAEVIDSPACKFGDGLEWAELLVPIEPGVNELGTLMTARLPGVDESPRFERGKTISSGGVTLRLSEDAVVEPNTLDYETEQLQQTFRAVALPEPAVSQLEAGFVAVFGLAPLDTSICPSPALSLENTFELEPGTELELYGLGLSALEEWVPYGTWKKLGEGAVSADGLSLDFPDGIAALTTIAVKVKE